MVEVASQCGSPSDGAEPSAAERVWQLVEKLLDSEDHRQRWAGIRLALGLRAMQVDMLKASVGSRRSMGES